MWRRQHRCTHTQAELSGGGGRVHKREREGEEEDEVERIGHKAQNEEEMGESSTISNSILHKKRFFLFRSNHCTPC